MLSLSNTLLLQETDSSGANERQDFYESSPRSAKLHAPRILGALLNVAHNVVVLMVGSVLTSIAITEFNGVSGRFAVKGARQTLMSMHARARVQAVEFGRTVKLHVDPGDDSIWLSRNGEVLDALDFGEEFKVDIQTSTDKDNDIALVITDLRMPKVDGFMVLSF